MSTLAMTVFIPRSRRERIPAIERFSEPGSMLAPVARRRSLPKERSTSAANSHPNVWSSCCSPFPQDRRPATCAP
jgi:hypothetical protein